MVVSLAVTFLGGIIGFFGLIFKNSIMQLVGGAIIIYALGVLNILPGWMIGLIVFLFIYLIFKKK